MEVVTRRIVIFAFDGVQPLDVAGPHEVFVGAAVALAAERRSGGYDVRVVSTGGGEVRSESGLRIGTDPADALEPGRIDTLLIPGGRGVDDAAADPDIITAVQQLTARSRRLVTVCTGAFVAAAAGLLGGRRVTTHWARGERLRRLHPDLDVDVDPIYVCDGDVWSSAGVTAGIDVALALVEQDHGPDVAQTVARWLVMFLRRPGGQSQFATPVWTARAAPGPIRAAQEAIEADPAGDHRLDLLARNVGMSGRHFLRCFTETVGTTPARYVAGVRVDAARRALETTDDTVEVIARRCGFGTAETMRRTFTRRLGVSPDRYRSRFTTAPT